MQLLIFLLVLFFLFRFVTKFLFGFIRETAKDSSYKSNDKYYSFKESLLVVIAAAMRADGSVSRSELNVVKQVLVSQFGENEAKKLLLRLRDILKTNINIVKAAQNIGSVLSYNDRKTIANILCEIVEADGIITSSEKQTVINICLYMNLSQYDTQRIASRLHVNGDERGRRNSDIGNDYEKSNIDKAYSVLGIKSDCTNSEVKNAYRAMVKKYHPDRVANQGEAVQKASEKIFKEIQTAYERIKASRGL